MAGHFKNILSWKRFDVEIVEDPPCVPSGKLTKLWKIMISFWENKLFLWSCSTAMSQITLGGSSRSFTSETHGFPTAFGCWVGASSGFDLQALAARRLGAGDVEEMLREFLGNS